MAEEYWYRFREVQYAAPVDEFDRPIGRGDMKLFLDKFKVLKVTPCGVRLDDYSGKGRFVRRDATKRWACPTIEEAKESFMARKTRQKNIYLARAEAAQRAINLLVVWQEPKSNIGWGW